MAVSKYGLRMVNDEFHFNIGKIFWSTHGGIKPKMKSEYPRKIRRPYHRRYIPVWKTIYGIRPTEIAHIILMDWQERKSKINFTKLGFYRNKPMSV